MIPALGDTADLVRRGWNLYADPCGYMGMPARLMKGDRGLWLARWKLASGWELDTETLVGLGIAQRAEQVVAFLR